MVIDFATLTGAARVAVGTDIAAYFSNNEALASSMQQAADAIEDPSWRLPLFKPYRKLFQSHLADLNNSPNNPYAGAITAALFLQSFVPDSTPWLHFDIMAFNPKSSPGKAEGGESMGIRAAFFVLEHTFGH
jgi:leucyl aminopeptidase